MELVLSDEIDPTTVASRLSSETRAATRFGARRRCSNRVRSRVNRETWLQPLACSARTAQFTPEGAQEERENCFSLPAKTNEKITQTRIFREKGKKKE